jgi:hypothetical protein
VTVDPQLEEALGALGIAAAVPALRQADETSTDYLDQTRRTLEQTLGDKPTVEVLACGAIARGTASAHSDFDTLVVTFGLAPQPALTPDVLSAVESVREDLKLREPMRPRPGRRIVAAQELVDSIGIEGDTAAANAARVAALTDSVSAYHPGRRDELMAALVGRYLAGYPQHKKGPPRPLVNDVLRCWRTLAVDYQAAAQDARPDRDWGLRYLDLVIGRKLWLAGTLAVIFTCEEATVEHFATGFAKPPLARLAGLLPLLAKPQRRAELRTVLEVAEAFTGALGDDGFRAEAAEVTCRAELDEHPHVRRMIIRARELQAALEGIFFDTPALAAQARKYLSF